MEEFENVCDTCTTLDHSTQTDASDVYFTQQYVKTANRTLTDRNASYNSSQGYDSENKSVEIGLIISTAMQVLALPACIVGNLIIFIALKKDRKLRMTQTNFYIISLTVADSLVGVAVIPFETVVNIERLMSSSSIETVIICVIHRVLIVFLLGSSLASMLLISIDRCIAISFPFFYAEKVTAKVIKGSIIGTWLLMLILCIPMFSSMTEERHTTHSCDFQWNALKTEGKIYAMIIYSFLILIFFSNVIFYSCVAKIAVKQHNRILEEMHHSSSQYLYNKGNIKNTKKMVVMFGVFIVLWLPYMVVLILQIAGACLKACTSARDISLSLGMMNSSINCYIYAWQKRDFKCAINKLLRVIKRKNRVLSVNLQKRAVKLPKTRTNSTESLFMISSKLSSKRTELSILAKCQSSEVMVTVGTMSQIEEEVHSQVGLSMATVGQPYETPTSLGTNKNNYGSEDAIGNKDINKNKDRKTIAEQRDERILTLPS